MKPIECVLLIQGLQKHSQKSAKRRAINTAATSATRVEGSSDEGAVCWSCNATSTAAAAQFVDDNHRRMRRLQFTVHWKALSHGYWKPSSSWWASKVLNYDAAKDHRDTYGGMSAICPFCEGPQVAYTAQTERSAYLTCKTLLRLCSLYSLVYTLINNNLYRKFALINLLFGWQNSVTNPFMKTLLCQHSLFRAKQIIG